MRNGFQWGDARRIRMATLTRSQHNSTLNMERDRVPTTHVPIQTSPQNRENQVMVPRILFGARGLGSATFSAVSSALGAGFLGLDSSNLPRFFNENAVGAAISSCTIGRCEDKQKKGRETSQDSDENYDRNDCNSSKENHDDRDYEELYVQTKFVPLRLQDSQARYSEHGSIKDQVFESHEQSEYSLIFRCQPGATRAAVGNRDLEDNENEEELRQCWMAMEALWASGAVKTLGIASSRPISPRLLDSIYRNAEVKPSIIQTVCRAKDGWDKALRSYCENRGILYQAVSLVRVNSYLLEDRDVLAIAQRHNTTSAQILIRFGMELGIIPVVITPVHSRMEEILDTLSFKLDETEVKAIENIAELYDYE
eukprot:jgi/Bigna1/132714/aug1.18_g7422